MPSLPNNVSQWSGAILNIKNLDVIDVAADSVSCTNLTVSGTNIVNLVNTFASQVQNISSTTTTTVIEDDVYLGVDVVYVDAINNRVGINNLTPMYTVDIIGNLNVTTELTCDDLRCHNNVIHT